MKFAPALSVFVLLAVVGCSGGVQKDASYGTVVALKDAAVAAGYSCPAWQQTNKRGAEEGFCRPDKGGSFDQFVTFANEADRDNGVKQTLMWGSVMTPQWVVLQGPNWLIRSDNGDDLTKLQRKLGGTVVRVPK